VRSSGPSYGFRGRVRRMHRLHVQSMGPRTFGGK
jgi:hypothetical protein